MSRIVSCSTSTLVLFLFTCWTGLVSGQEPEKRTLPQQMTKETVEQVKKSTVYLKVTTLPWTNTGTGFLAVEPGIVITNAHVLRMLERNSKPPTTIEVYLNSGEAKEKRLTGKVIAVDRAADLAVVRIEGKLPPALPLDTHGDLYETQKLYVFGFPFGERLGKNVTVSESSVSSLRKEADGSLQNIQVNGGMQPGNSGGPVVNSLGEVVGVSVAIVAGTQINFAIPTDKIRALMHGTIDEIKAGEPFRAEDEVRLPLKCTCVDPINRIREVRVEVWAGKPTDKNSVSPKKSAPKNVDRKSYALKSENGYWSADVPLPKLGDGQVAWVRPVVDSDKGEPIAFAPRSFAVGIPVERVPAEVAVKFPAKQERTVHLKATMSLTQDKVRLFTRVAELDILEQLAADSEGTIIKTNFGSLRFSDRNGNALGIIPPGVKDLPALAPTYLVDATGALLKRVNPPDRNLFMQHIRYGYELTNLVLPTKKLQPLETWEVMSPAFLTDGAPPKDGFNVLALTYTYEGLRTGSGSREACITFTGPRKSSSAKTAKDTAMVTGKLSVDLDKGFISSLALTCQFDNPSREDVLSAELTRIEGNPKKIVPLETAPPEKE
jgi:Trypsin-like peptidase domain